MQRLLLVAVGVALSITATAAHAAGLRFIEVAAEADTPALKGAMWYPCAAPPGDIDLGEVTAKFGMTLRGLKDCPISGDKLPLVVMSHGTRDHFVFLDDTAETLADAGFIVAAINHPGDSFGDVSRAGSLSVVVERPTDIKRLIDFMLGESPVASKIDLDRIGFDGFSAGGYTGLVLIGADIDWASLFCHRSSAASVCEQILRKEFRVQPLTHDERIRAAIIVDPPGLLFGADSFAAVKTPVQLWASEYGAPEVEVMPKEVAAVDRNLPETHEYHVVPNANHHVFGPPCPPAAAKAMPEGCNDPPGFDRAAFHKQFNADVLAFFRAHLGDR